MGMANSCRRRGCGSSRSRLARTAETHLRHLDGAGISDRMARITRHSSSGFLRRIYSAGNASKGHWSRSAGAEEREQVVILADENAAKGNAALPEAILILLQIPDWCRVGISLHKRVYVKIMEHWAQRIVEQATRLLLLWLL
jgi:hypothetical protein